MLFILLMGDNLDSFLSFISQDLLLKTYIFLISNLKLQ